MPNTPRPTSFIHTTNQNGDTYFTIMNTMDGTTPSSCSTTSFRPNTTVGSHATALHTLQTAVLQCYGGAQADYTHAYTAKAINANLSKISTHQCIEECADATAIIIYLEDT
jgi:hypothetical protein